MQQNMRMKHTPLLALVLLAVLLAACKGKGTTETPSDVLPVAEQDTVTHSMAGCDFNDSIQAWGSHLTFTIHREPCDSMPIITDQYGTKYKDNLFVLTIMRGGQTFFRHLFTKNDFSSLLGADFRKHGMFDGFRCAGYQDDKLTFGTCVSFPESDMSQPFLVKVARDGSYVIEVDKTPINENPADIDSVDEGV